MEEKKKKEARKRLLLITQNKDAGSDQVVVVEGECLNSGHMIQVSISRKGQQREIGFWTYFESRTDRIC